MRFCLTCMIFWIAVAHGHMNENQCPDNEVYSNNTCLTIKSCQPTCPPAQLHPCPMICLNGGCVCKSGYLRDPQQNYTCVAKERCPKPDAQKGRCGKGEVWTDGCVNPCPETCPPYVIRPCTKMCILGGCTCKKDYVRDQYKNNTCVPRDKCSKHGSQEHQCPKNEVWIDGCVLPRWCQETCPPYVRKPCPCLMGGCNCKKNYVRDQYDNNTCIAKARCPKNGSTTTLSPQKCPQNEQWSDCALLPVSCQGLCPNAPSTGMMCSQMCHEACVCEPGYVRDPKKQYKCVKEQQC